MKLHARRLRLAAAAFVAIYTAATLAIPAASSALFGGSGG